MGLISKKTFFCTEKQSKNPNENAMQERSSYTAVVDDLMKF